MTYHYEIVKEMKSQTKAGKHLYLFDLFFVIGFIIAAFLFEKAVHPSLRIFFYIFAGVAGFILCRATKRTNPDKRIFQAMILVLRRSWEMYQDADVFTAIDVPSQPMECRPDIESNRREFFRWKRNQE